MLRVFFKTFKFIFLPLKVSNQVFAVASAPPLEKKVAAEVFSLPGNECLYLQNEKRSLDERRKHLSRRLTLPHADQITDPADEQQQTESSKEQEDHWTRRERGDTFHHMSQKNTSYSVIKSSGAHR